MNNEATHRIEFEKEGVTPTVIKVVGVGGGGCNALNRMVEAGLDSVDFIGINTDAQALGLCKATQKLAIGRQTTRGLGSGADPKKGAMAAEEDFEMIQKALKGADMVFITAGMGKGTGTGASPVVARAAKEMGCLTVAIVTKPFLYEGRRNLQKAEEGIAELSKYVDTLLVIANQNLLKLADRKMAVGEAFQLADSVLLQGVRGIAEIITRPGAMNVDFADVKTIMAGRGNAILGMATTSAEMRGVEAAEKVVTNPLLENASMEDASGLLISVTHGTNFQLLELHEIVNAISSKVNIDADIIVGTSVDPKLEGELRVTVIATGFPDETKTKARIEPPRHQELGGEEDIDVIPTDRPEKQMKLLRDEDYIVSESSLSSPEKTNHEKDEYEIPAFLRRANK
jgi:cell division protein FtsZ